MRLHALVREPLVQFLAIGAMLATVHALAPEDPAGAPQDAAEPIRVSEERIEQLGALFERTWQRAPTPAELEGLVESFVREEVLYRAGTDLGLGEDDAVVRRRIAQKMEFLLEPAPGEIAPTTADLRRHLAAFPERFRRPARLSFKQVYLGRVGHEAGASAAVEEVLAALEAGADPSGLGEPTLLPASVADARATSVARSFGEDFATAVLEAPTGQWTGPVRSAYGSHLVKVGQRIPARAPDLDEVRDAVAADWEAKRRREVMAERLQALQARYPVELPGPDGAAPDAGGADQRADAARGTGP